uniref:Double zinc ribbon and ankyrin repeat-containing protein 1 isoform X2 n=1 Tax=Pogona vitticeps TaxID=103695 RepID=A0ABM5G9W3_9SAUR
MTAGSILVPQIIPLREPIPGKAKHEIDTNTLIEMKSDTPDVTIYYAIDGSKPQLSRRLDCRDHNTFKYNVPITLPDGKITVKALAVAKDYRESAIVTKVFVVEYVTSYTPVPDENKDENFLKDLSKQEMEGGLSELSLTKKEVNAESKFHWNYVAEELQECSVPSHLSEPHLKKNYWTTLSDRKETHSAILMPQSQGKVLCCVCGAENPIHIKHCVICDNKLPEAHMPGLFPFHFTCFKCSARNYPHDLFCGTCGVFIEPSCRLDTDDTLVNAGDDFVISKNYSLQTWQQSTNSLPTPRTNLVEKKEQGTQTTGLYYPSSKLLEKKEYELVSQTGKQNKVHDHKPLLTAISPGRGYWRKQLDHVCAHLRSYTQNNVAFRTSIGEPQMGKLISATIHEDGYQVSLHLNYALAINKNIFTSKPVTFDYHGLRPNGTMELSENQANLATEASQRTPNPNKKVRRIIKTRKYLEKEDRLTIESRQLLKEVGPKGQGQPLLIEQLIDEGADPNYTNSDEEPALTLAVLNKHHEAIPVLVQKGADIDHQSGPENNTALHEAVLLGMEGWECIEALLGCNADIRKKNTRGLSASDLALKSGNDKIVSLFAKLMEK